MVLPASCPHSAVVTIGNCRHKVTVLDILWAGAWSQMTSALGQKKKIRAPVICEAPRGGGSVLHWSLKIMHWSPKIPENIFLGSLKVFWLAPQSPRSSSASPQIPKIIISQFSIKCIFLSVGLKSYTFKTMKLYKSAWLNDNLIFCLIHVKTGLKHGIHDIYFMTSRLGVK